MMSELVPVLVLFAAAGYVTLRLCANRTRFRWDALSWEQNLFEAGAVGLLLFALVRCLALVLPMLAELPMIGDPATWVWSMVQVLARGIGEVLPLPYAGSLVAMFGLGVAGGLLSNRLWGPSASVQLAIDSYGGDLKILLHTVAAEGAPVLLTMNTRKVYVGLVMVPPSVRDPSYVTLLRTLSGYREPKALRVHFTTRYEPVYDDREENLQELEEFYIVLPLRDIVSANRFDHDVYKLYFESEATQREGELGPEAQK